MILKNNLDNIQDFLTCHGWEKRSHSKYFDCYYAPVEAQLPTDFFLEIPRNAQDNGFQRYTNDLIPIIQDIYDKKYSFQDIKTFFTTKNCILSLQLEDDDTRFGKIKLERLKGAFNNVFNAIKKSLIFDATNEPIFAKAQFQRHGISNYLDMCRGLQTDIGSYIIKMELPETRIQQLSLFPVDRSIPKMLVDAIQFLIQTSANIHVNSLIVDKQFIMEHKLFMNVEMLDAIVKFCKEAAIQNMSIHLDSHRTTHEKYFHKVDKQLVNIDLLVKKIKNFLLQENPLVIDGNIVKLSSKKPTQSGTIWMEGMVSDEKLSVEVKLVGDDYTKALDAHSNDQHIRIKGVAKQITGNKFIIEQVDEFTHAA